MLFRIHVPARVVALPLALAASSGFAADMAFTIPALPEGKTLTFTYEEEIAPSLSPVTAAYVSRQALVTADFSPAAQSAPVATRIDNPPVLDLNGPDQEGTGFLAAFVQRNGPAPLSDSDAVLEERASPAVERVEVTLSSLPNGTDESLDVDLSVAPGVSKSYDPVNGVLTLSGTAPPAVYEALIRTVTYSNTAALLDPAGRSAAFVVYDDFSGSAPALTTFTAEVPVTLSSMSAE